MTLAAPLEDLTFRPSAETSLGVELELQIVDRETGDLAPGAVRLLPAAEAEQIEGVSAELFQSIIEIKTGVCPDVAAVRASLFPRLRRLWILAASLGYDLALGGTHPFNRPSTSSIYPAQRYENVHERMGWLTSHALLFGLHVHVGMPDGDVALGVTSILVQYLPHLLAISASSPFWQGVDTGLASTRSALFRLVPHASVPHYFASWKDFTRYIEVMRDCQAIRNTKDIYWDIRPRPQQGTIEIRVCDMPSSLTMVLALAALIRCLALSALRLLEDRPRLRRGDLRRYWVVAENKWLATRYGLKAQCIRSPGGKRQTLAQDLASLLDRLAPIAEETGDAPFLAALQPVEQLETGADRQRRAFRASGSWQDVVEDMKQQLARELEAGD